MAPGALTRMVYAIQDSDSSFIAAADALTPEIVSPAVAFLAHESVPFTGECIESIGGKVSNLYLARTPGFADPSMTVETLAARWREIMDGRPEGVSRHNEADPRQWSPKPYVAV